MRNAEGLVQVQVRHVATELPWRAQADHGIHVRAVDVHLPARGMNNVANLADPAFEHPVGRGVGNHQRSQLVAVLQRLAL
ncbi:hypothetical protein D3C80_1189940 [compost metagenome]